MRFCCWNDIRKSFYNKVKLWPMRISESDAARISHLRGGERLKIGVGRKSDRIVAEINLITLIKFAYILFLNLIFTNSYWIYVEFMLNLCSRFHIMSALNFHSSQTLTTATLRIFFISFPISSCRKMLWWVLLPWTFNRSPNKRAERSETHR